MLPVRFLPHAVQLNTAGSVDAWINQLDTSSPDQGVTLFEESSGSQTDREFTAAKLVAPTLPLVTSDLSAIATVGMAGVAISAGETTPGCIAYARELPLSSLPAAIASEVHISIAVSDGLLVPTGIRATNNEVAKLSMHLHAILGSGDYSGATPMVMTSDVAIPSGAAATTNIYTAGVVKYTVSGGSSRLLQGIMSQSVDFGIQVLKESDSGEAHPTQIAIIARYPKVMFTTKDEDVITEIGDGISISSCAIYFRAVSENGQRIANATTSHISIIGTAGMITPNPTTLQHRQAGTAAFTFTPSINTNLFTISTSSAIPTS